MRGLGQLEPRCCASRASREVDRESKRALLFELAALHEPAGSGSGYELRAEQKNFDRFLDMIVGFELEVLDARAVFKLAQDKGPECADLAAVLLAHLVGQSTSCVLPLLRAPLREA